MKKTKLFIIALVMQFCVTLGLGSIVAYGNVHDRAPEGLIVWGQDLSGLSRTQVSTILKEKIPDAVTYKDQVYPLKMVQTNADIEQWLDQVFPEPTGNWIIDVFNNLIHPATVFPLKNIGMNHEEVIAQLQSISGFINKPPRAATISYSGAKLIKTDGQLGQKLDIEGSWQKISQDHEHKQVKLTVEDIPVQPDTEDMEKIGSVLGDYTTYFNPQDVPRTTNLRLAAEALNNHLILPGQIFSFNEIVGERTVSEGYLPAYVFIDRSAIKETGGGICQDSSTLFQAVNQANLPIEERHTHSLPVSYVKKGQDATVFFGSLDFRFQNDTQAYLLLSVSTGSNWLRIRIFGLADDKHPSLLKPDGYPNRPENWLKDPK